MRFGCSIATPSSAFTMRRVPPKDQTEEKNSNPQKRSQNASRLRTSSIKEQKENQERVMDSAELSAVKLEDLLWRGEPWSDYKQKLQDLQMSNYDFIRENSGFVFSDKPVEAKDFFNAMEKQLLEPGELTKLAIRQVAYLHPQRCVAGVDGVHTLKPEEQQRLYDEIGQYLNSCETDAFRFECIPRAREALMPWTEEITGMEPYQHVCVCTMRDRVKQVITAWVMEPLCEARYAETNVFGHRPGRLTKEFIEWLQTTLRGPPVSMAVFKADVVSPEKVADFVDKYFPSYPFTGLRSWIDSGLFELGMYPPGLGRHGEEQGCPILPILSNFLCHHLMKEVGDSVPSVHLASWHGNIIAMTHFSDEVFSDVQARLEEVADSVGLKILMTTPVRPCHKDWVEFCEFSFCQEKIRPNDDVYSAIVRPRETVMERHLQNLSTVFFLSDNTTEGKAQLIKRLNLTIDDFTHHFAQTYAGDCFERADEYLENLLIMWSCYHSPLSTNNKAVGKKFARTSNRDLRSEFRTNRTRLVRHGVALRNHTRPFFCNYNRRTNRYYRSLHISEWKEWLYCMNGPVLETR